MEGMRSEIQDLSFRELTAHTDRKGIGPVASDAGMRDGSGAYTNLALILSDQCPWSCEFRVDDVVMVTLTGSVLEQIRTVDKSLAEIRGSLASRSRMNIPKLPSLSFYEVVLNAFTHRSYCSREPVIIDVSLERVVVTSPGGVMRLGASYNDRTRNPKLAAVLQTLGVKNRLIRGIPGVLQTYRCC